MLRWVKDRMLGSRRAAAGFGALSGVFLGLVVPYVLTMVLFVVITVLHTYGGTVGQAVALPLAHVFGAVVLFQGWPVLLVQAVAPGLELDGLPPGILQGYSVSAWAMVGAACCLVARAVALREAGRRNRDS